MGWMKEISSKDRKHPRTQQHTNTLGTPLAIGPQRGGHEFLFSHDNPQIPKKRRGRGSAVSAGYVHVETHRAEMR